MRTNRSAAVALIGSLALAACHSTPREEGPEVVGAGGVADPTFQKKTLAAELAAGEPLYEQHCAQCHEGGVLKAPHKMFLQMMAADAILRSLETGIMQAQAAALSGDDRRQVAEYLAGQTLAEAAAAPQPVRCDEDAGNLDPTRPPRVRGWGITPANTRFIPGNVAGLSRDEVGKLELKWVFAYPNAQRARSQPTVAMGAVFVGSQDGTVYALDRETGCVHWTFRASAEVRTPIVIAPWTAGEQPHSRPIAVFGDLLARVYAIDALTGELLWQHKADDHPNATITAAPVLHENRVYVAVSSLEVTSAADPEYACCTFRGSIVALDIDDGEVVWKSYSIPDAPREVGRTAVGTPILAPSGAPIWNSPTLDLERGVIYAGTGENYSSPANHTSDALLAFRLEDGRLLWHTQATAGDAWNVACMIEGNPNCPEEDGPDVDFGASTILTTLPDGQRLLLAGQKSGEVLALDPDRNGTILWRRKIGRGGIQGGVHFGMALEGERLYVPISDMANEYVEDPWYEGPPRPGLYALDVRTGELLWSTPAVDVCNGREFCEPGISAAITAMPGVVFAGHMDGWLKAYDAATGQVIWAYDTARDFESASGIPARGGSFGGGSGPVVDDGLLLVNSGYGIYYHMGGNVLLAFEAAD
ncbi:MAG TPA: PQQ-binding-like beta-propeller repeat protein [Steroidobacteraceae bacterium]|nr:PQQ-binding-like beta-propeller repeat protein [Steroidobacteraceae bacterium]